MNQTGRETTSSATRDAARDAAREALRPSGGRGPQVAPGESIETALQLAIDLHGPGLLGRPDKLRLHLDAQCPGAGFDLSFLLVALEEGVPQALLGMESAAQMQVVVPRLQEMLAERRGLNPFAATWAVSTWAAALRMDLFGHASDDDTVRLHDVVEPRPVGAEAPIASPAFTVPFGVATTASSAVEARQAATIVDATDAMPAEVDAVAARPAVPARATEASVRPHEPVQTVQAVQETLSSPADGVTSAHAVPPLTETALPTWAAAKKEGPGRARFSGWWGLGGVVVAIVVAWGAARWTTSPDERDVPAESAPPASTAAPVAPSTPVAAAAAAPTPVAPSIVDVVSDATLPGDGSEHAVFVTVDPARRDVRSVEATFMSGDGLWEPRSRTVDVEADAIRDGRIAVGSIALRTTKPATATFRYVLTTADGERSTPFVKQFVFTPVAGRPPVVADIAVPPGIVAGTPFTLTIHFTPGDAGIASVERTLVGSDEPPRTTSMAGLATPSAGTLRYPVEAIASASRTTFSIVLIDADGERSDPQRIVVEAAAPTPRADRAVPKTDVASRERTDVAACTRTTCGSVVSVREIDRTRTYEVIARMDDRTIRTMVSTAAWRVGTRVRRAGSRFAPVDGVVVAPPRAKAAARTPAPIVSESPPIFDRW